MTIRYSVIDVWISICNDTFARITCPVSFLSEILEDFVHFINIYVYTYMCVAVMYVCCSNTCVLQ